VKLLVEAVSPRTRVICSVKLLVEAVSPGCSVKLFVEAVPTRSLLSTVRNRANSSTAARLRSRRTRFVYPGLVGGDQQVPDAEVSARNVGQVRLFDLVTAVQPE
jgi:hypothetical protein